MPYINSDSFRCLLGAQSKEVEVIDNLFLWKVGKNKVVKHFSVNGKLTEDHIEKLKTHMPSNFHYISEENLDILKNNFEITKSKKLSIILDIRDLSFKGNDNKSIRHCLNRCSKEGFVIEKNFRNFNDVLKLVDTWSNNYTEKYFRDNSGKNSFFYKNNFHEGLYSLFFYNGDELKAFGTLSRPVDGYSSYVLGKALYKDHYGLSEFADVELYKYGKENGIEYVNMGSATKGLINYKKKFNSIEEICYDGSIEAIK